MGNDLSPQSKEKLITIKGQVPPPETISLSNCSQGVYPSFLKKYPHLKHLLFVHPLSLTGSALLHHMR